MAVLFGVMAIEDIQDIVRDYQYVKGIWQVWLAAPAFLISFCIGFFLRRYVDVLALPLRERLLIAFIVLSPILVGIIGRHYLRSDFLNELMVFLMRALVSGLNFGVAIGLRQRMKQNLA